MKFIFHRFVLLCSLLLMSLFFVGYLKAFDNFSFNESSGGVKFEFKEDNVLPWVEIGNTKILVELATTSAAVIKGLSGRKFLEPDQGMLFIFSRPDFYRFWMPDMNFPIDILWLNNNKIVDISENVSEDFDPADPNFFSPKVEAQQVLEVNAGFSKKHKFSVGDTVKFNNIE